MNFKYPSRWAKQVRAIEVLLQECERVGRKRFGLELDRAPSVYIVPWRRVEFIADWERNEILLGFRFYPALDQWLYSVHFGECHEYGHLLWHPSSSILREAWASYFALDVLESHDIRGVIPSYMSRILMAKDRRLSMGILAFQRYIGSQVERAIANIIYIWRTAGSASVSAFLSSISEATETEENTLLVPAFAAHFGVPENICGTWLRED